MSRLAVLFLTLCAFVATVFSTPVPNATEVLEKRITHTGRGTWFEVGLGACGDYNVDSDAIVAISHDIYGNGGNCNQWIAITNTETGITQYGLTRDECMGCDAISLDMSPSLFESLGADLGAGVLQISWHFMNKAWQP
ncbi:hypothetical protein AcW2_007115 [Taiwanofungus camphoratus]|nr:hypothetical protein AcW2_007115 [Antrodia cinnamomea]